MAFFKNYYNIISTLVFLSAIVIAQISSTHNYDWTRNTISDLGSQGYDKKAIMQLGFLTFGLLLVTGILYNGLTWQTTPILIYGVCIALTGVFCTKPFWGQNSYSVHQANIHSFLAQIAGISFTIGILVQLFYAETFTEKWLHFSFFFLVVTLSALFGIIKDYQGILQRLLYLTSFLWLVKFYKT